MPTVFLLSKIYKQQPTTPQPFLFYMKKLSFFISFFILQGIYAQEERQVFTYEQFMQQVSQQHPTAQQIKLLSERAAREQQRAKGQFDPVLESYYDRKLFNESNYYDLFKTALVIPTYYGVSAEVGFQHNTGDYVNPEDKTPYDGQAYLGINVNLLQGLINNERNTILQQAKLLTDINNNQAQSLLNGLLYEAAYVYWEWAFAYNEVKIWRQAYTLAQNRLEATRQSFIFGDKPALDTLETFSNLLDRQIRLQESELDYQQSTFALNMFLWGDNQPLEIDKKLIPMRFDSSSVDTQRLNRIVEALPQNHPELRLYEFQLKSLGLEQQLKNNKLLPKLDLKYNFLAYNAANFFPSSAGNMFDNYKLGVKFSYPLLTRTARADVGLNRVKIAETKFKFSQKRWELNNKIRSYQAEINNFAAQIGMLKQNVSNYEQLLAAEYEKFRLGESSIFWLNSREIKLIETQQKLLSVQTKFEKAKASFAWVAAQLANF